MLNAGDTAAPAQINTMAATAMPSRVVRPIFKG